MSHRWSKSTDFELLRLDVDDRSCGWCSRFTHVCDHRHRSIYTLRGPMHLVCGLRHCPDEACPGFHKTVSPEREIGIALPYWAIGWDVFAWIGHRRFARHWGIPQIRQELEDTHEIVLSDDAIEVYLHRYQAMLAARQQDPTLLAQEYQGVDSLLLSIDGLQPEKGHETLYAVRELRRRRVWFAESLISSSTEEVRRLLVRARQWADQLGLPVAGCISDKQEAFVTSIAAEFPGVPHLYCQNHFLRDLAKPMLEADSRAKVKMRRKVRGLRAIEREVLSERREEVSRVNGCQNPDSAGGNAEAACTAGTASRKEEEGAPCSPGCSMAPATGTDPGDPDGAGPVVLDYCTAVRGILNSDQGGPLSPPGLRMAGALKEVHQSIRKNLDAKKGGLQSVGSVDWLGVSSVDSTPSNRDNEPSRNSLSTCGGSPRLSTPRADRANGAAPDSTG